MRKVVQFEALGLACVPWSVPSIGNVTTKAGKRVRFTTRAKKSDLAAGKASLEDWQKFVAGRAREAMATVALQSGPVKVHFDFYRRTPKGRRHGEIWFAGLRWDEEKSAWSKLGRSEPDVTNLIKGTEDSVQNIIYANDVQTRIISASAWYGPQDGVRVTVYAIEPEDFPGHGDPVT